MLILHGDETYRRCLASSLFNVQSRCIPEMLQLQTISLTTEACTLGPWVPARSHNTLSCTPRLTSTQQRGLVKNFMDFFFSPPPTIHHCIPELYELVLQAKEQLRLIPHCPLNCRLVQVTEESNWLSDLWGQLAALWVWNNRISCNGWTDRMTGREKRRERVGPSIYQIYPVMFYSSVPTIISALSIELNLSQRSGNI